MTLNQATRHIGLNAHLLSLGGGYRSAGISGYIYQLLRHLPRVSEDRYTVWTGERDGDLGPMERRVSPLPTHRPAVRLLWEQFLQPYALLRQRPDLLHALAFVLPLALPVPGVVTVYDLTFLRVPEAFRPLNRLYLRTMVGRSARRAARVCAISEHGRQDIAAALDVPLDRIAVVPPGLDPRFAQPPAPAAVAAFRAARNLPESFLLYLGTLEPRKNLPLLLRAFDRIRAAHPGLKLLLAGGRGWQFQEIDQEIERLGLAEAVLQPGFVPEQEQALWYAAATLFVYPSLYEGFGLPPLEAMACGTPVVCSDAASLTEVVGDAGVTHAPDDEEGLAAILDELLRDPGARDRMRAAGLARAATFDWQESARRQAAIYHQVLGGAR